MGPEWSGQVGRVTVACGSVGESGQIEDGTGSSFSIPADLAMEIVTLDGGPRCASQARRAALAAKLVTWLFFEPHSEYVEEMEVKAVDV